MLGVVVVGGVIGVALRELLLLPLAAQDGAPDSIAVPVATAGVNIVGSFVLGIVVGGLGDRHPLTRAFLGTGVIGGFTTYSAFAVQAAGLLASVPLAGIALAVVSVLLGLAAGALGLRLTQRPAAPGGSGGSRGPEAVR